MAAISSFDANGSSGETNASNGLIPMSFKIADWYSSARRFETARERERERERDQLMWLRERHEITVGTLGSEDRQQRDGLQLPLFVLQEVEQLLAVTAGCKMMATS